MVVSSTTPEPAMTTTPTALDTYLQRLPMILDKLEALRQLASVHGPVSTTGEIRNDGHP
jgi:hypothetical protein